jgi:glucokinase
MRALAVDLGGSHATCALVEDRKLLGCETVRLDCGAGLVAALSQIQAALRRVLDRSPGPCAGLTLGFCGLVDSVQGRVVGTNAKYADAGTVDLPGWCSAAFGIPFRLENDTRMALLGERYAGAALGCDDVVMVTLGTGIGGAAMIEGRLLRGKHFQAGCLGGHLPAVYNGRQCTCGALGCVEAEASTWSLPELCRATPGFDTSALATEAAITFEVLMQTAALGDTVARTVRDRCLEVWGSGAIALIHAYDPEVLVYGGGVLGSADIVLPFIQEYVNRHAWTPWGKVQVRCAQLGNHAALFGAVPLLSSNGL